MIWWFEWECMDWRALGLLVEGEECRDEWALGLLVEAEYGKGVFH